LSDWVQSGYIELEGFKMRARKYQRLIALLVLNFVLLSGMMLYTGSSETGYQIRILPVYEWGNRERAWGVAVKEYSPTKLQMFLRNRALKSGLGPSCCNPSNFQFVPHINPPYRVYRVYYIGILRIGTPMDFFAECDETMLFNQSRIASYHVEEYRRSQSQ
jgi:hypothetical protein